MKVRQQGYRSRRRKPDIMLVLVVIAMFGVLVTTHLQGALESEPSYRAAGILAPVARQPTRVSLSSPQAIQRR